MSRFINGLTPKQEKFYRGIGAIMLVMSMIMGLFDMFKKKYEDIANILGILPETYFNKANSLPAMYRISIQKRYKIN